MTTIALADAGHGRGDQRGRGAVVRAGEQLLVLESMKMEHVVAVVEPGVVARIDVAVGDTVKPGDRLMLVDPGVADHGDRAADEAVSAIDDAPVRTDLVEVLSVELVLDHRRPEAAAWRRATPAHARERRGSPRRGFLRRVRRSSSPRSAAAARSRS